MRYVITIDDDDRDDDTLGMPWVAVVSEPAQATDESGIGATPAEALADLARDWIHAEQHTQ